MNILLGVTGSVAAVLTPKLIQKLTERGHIVTVVMTDTAPKFLKEKITYYKDEDEWSEFNEIGDPILHIELRKWADILLIAPCTVNTIAKIAGGLCDNLLTNIVMAWDYSKPFYIAPAANTFMWNNNIVQDNIKKIHRNGIRIISPVEKLLACGDTGVGAMAHIDMISYQIDICKDLPEGG
jgi:phosphopantothenoylcysteine decarboxylase